MTSRSKLQILLLMLIVALSAGCAREPRTPLRIGTNAWIGYEPVIWRKACAILTPA